MERIAANDNINLAMILIKVAVLEKFVSLNRNVAEYAPYVETATEQAQSLRRYLAKQSA